MDGPNLFCEKVLLLLENGLYFWRGPMHINYSNFMSILL